MNIIQRLKQYNRLQISILLFFMTIFCIAISFLRYQITDTKIFLFLNWNLFLAFIPWVLSSLIILFELRQKWILGILIAVWILFFPNSPYILTDLFHLRLRSNVPIWFDLVVILSFAWTGLVYGFVSLMDIEKLLERYIKPNFISFLAILFLFLSSFGIYLGRYLRWNSWDIINQPSNLMYDISDRVLNPTDHPATWGMTILMGILLNMMYFSIKFLRKI